MTRRSLLLASCAAPLHSANPDVRLHRPPKPLAKGAKTHDWTRFLGPSMNAISTETRLNRSLPPPLVWELRKGSGYASPAILGDKLVYFYRNGDREIVDCLHRETGERYWQFHYPTTFEDRYGYNNGPRASPVIEADRVYTMGAQGVLHCLDFVSGKLIWKRELNREYKVPQDFFGTASTPLVEGDKLVVNIGAPGGPSVIALRLDSGKEIWRAANDWGPSYASPVSALIHGQRRVFVFAGGESDPPTGGLLSIDPANGKIDFAFPWRSRSYESVNASCPVVFENKVFISASYRTGGALLEIQPNFTHKVLWTTSEFGLHFNTPVYREGYLYGFDGRNEPDASLACLNVKTGKIVWRHTPEWVEQVGGRKQLMSTYRGTLLAVDGHFLCLGELGHLLWLDLTPDGYRELGRCWLFAARETWALPVLSRGLLYISQNTRDVLNQTPPRLLCYDLRA
ncbi:MAG: PQQ-like beta-propeller repeat protein [Bryobacteraceae bacterium]|nr:PQQ-like beta-propeller repeat protein [Bryobacteraceae bacterium]MDW8377261.1 PQQ-binding-like beta-propeller repeat protein [Bryobacterales bacterium]